MYRQSERARWIKPASAAATVASRTAARSPSKCRVEVSTAPLRLAQPKQTIPTGFAGVPPEGPATPVTATARSAVLLASAPEAISAATASSKSTKPFCARERHNLISVRRLRN